MVGGGGVFFGVDRVDMVALKVERAIGRLCKKLRSSRSEAANYSSLNSTKSSHTEQHNKRWL